MAKNQESYTPKFKQQIVDLYHTENYSYPQLEREWHFPYSQKTIAEIVIFI